MVKIELRDSDSDKKIVVEVKTSDFVNLEKAPGWHFAAKGRIIEGDKEESLNGFARIIEEK